jgi:acetyl-CoA carboxylase carboxyl transferase subunit alpha
VISPEGCASILWHDAAKAPDAADAMKVIPDDLMNMGICDRIIEEPLGGAHRNSAEMATILKSVLLDEIAQLKEIDADTFLARRIERYDKMGVFTES